MAELNNRVGVIRLTGTLRCATPEDARLVERLLPDHIPGESHLKI
jgi:hypothetical protein